jgi:hypothetical protein
MERNEPFITSQTQKVSSNFLVAEPEGSTLLMAKPATGHDPEPVPSTSHPHNPFH